MIDEKYFELMNKEIDSVITKAEKEKLQSYLSTNPEAQNFYIALHQTSERLSQIPEVESPPNIKKYVMNSIDLTRYSVSKKPGKFSSLRLNVLAKPSPKFAFAFALGIVIGILVYSGFLENVISKRDLDLENFYGTVGVDEKAGFKTLASIQVALPEMNGSIIVKRLDHIVVIGTDVRTQQETEIYLEYDQSGLQYSHFNSDSKSKISLEPDDNSIRIFFSRDIRYHLFFTEITAVSKTVTLRFFTAGELALTKEISL
jgi:hypothetical protein